jgi:hypothetical protein
VEFQHGSGANLQEVKEKLDIFASAIDQQRKKADQQNWSSGDAVSVGALMTVVGGLADQTGLFNTGAGLATLGVSASDRYKYTSQKNAFAGASDVLGCVQSVVNETPDKYLQWAALSASSNETQEIAVSAPRIAVDIIKEVQRKLLKNLYLIENKPLSAEQYKQWIVRQDRADRDIQSENAVIDSNVKSLARERAAPRPNNLAISYLLIKAKAGDGTELTQFQMKQAIVVVTKFKLNLEACTTLYVN